MAAMVATATCTGHRAVLEASGEVVAGPVLAERVAWLIALMRAMTAGIVSERWNARDLDVLVAGVGLDGRVLPVKGWMAIRRLGWGCAAAVSGGVYASDRVRRCAEEVEARGVRRGNAALSGQVRGTVIEAIRHLAAKDGIAVVTVPARGTSHYCPRCGEGGHVLRHAPAPDRLGVAGSGPIVRRAGCRATAIMRRPSGSPPAACSASATPGPPRAPACAALRSGGGQRDPRAPPE